MDKALLIDLGLNDLKAEVYGVLLLQPEALTGYKIGKKLGKPTANVYKALDSLAKKGAMLLEDQASRQCKALPLAEFCDLVEAGHSVQDDQGPIGLPRAPPGRR